MVAYIYTIVLQLRPTGYVLIQFFILFIYLFILGLHPQQYGCSQASNWIGAAAASHSHNNSGSKPHLQPTPQLTEMLILNPLSEARDQIRVLMNTSWVCYHWVCTFLETDFFQLPFPQPIPHHTLILVTTNLISFYKYNWPKRTIRFFRKPSSSCIKRKEPIPNSLSLSLSHTHMHTHTPHTQTPWFSKEMLYIMSLKYSTTLK